MEALGAAQGKWEDFETISLLLQSAVQYFQMFVCTPHLATPLSACLLTKDTWTWSMSL